MTTENLAALKDDMIAFVEGHGMRYFPALIPEDCPRVWWSDEEAEVHEGASDSWKDFVEMAKTAGAPMVCIAEDRLERATLELLTGELEEAASPQAFAVEMEKLDGLYPQVGKVGHLELAFAHQGVLFVHETATAWYHDYREMLDTLEELTDLSADVFDDEDEEPR
jgi:hypothetical protein